MDIKKPYPLSLGILLSSLFLFGQTTKSSAAHDPHACLTSDPKNNQILSNFKFESDDPKFQPDLCDQKNLAYRVAKSLLFLSDRTDLELALDNVHVDPYTYFHNRVDTIRFMPPGGDCHEHTDAYVIPSPANKDMHVCQNIADNEDFNISAILIHEARHHDADGYHHVVCDHGFQSQYDDLACDQSYSTRGSYGVESEYLVGLSRSSHVDASVRQDSRAQAILNFMQRFNELPLGMKKGAVLLSNDNSVDFYDGLSTAHLFNLKSNNQDLYQAREVLKVYDPDNRTISNLEDGTLISKVRHDITPADPATFFRDLYVSRLGECHLYLDHLICYFEQKKVELPITDFTPVGFESYSLFRKDDLEVHITATNGNRYSISENSTSFRVDSNWPIRNIGDWSNDQVLVLTIEGKLSFVSRQVEGTDRPTTGIAPDATYKKMIAPHYWSKQLQDL